MRISGPGKSFRSIRDGVGGLCQCYGFTRVFFFYVLFPNTLYEGTFVLIGYFSGILVIICSLGLLWACHYARGYLGLYLF